MLSCSRNECYYEEPYAGKPHVRICEGLRLRGLSLLDSYYISVDVIKHLHLFLYNKGNNWPDGIPIGLSHPFDKQSAIPLLYKFG